MQPSPPLNVAHRVESNNGDATVGNLTSGKLSPVKPPLCSYVVDAWVQLTAGPDVSACVYLKCFSLFFSGNACQILKIITICRKIQK
jgi:hypothetical protein